MIYLLAFVVTVLATSRIARWVIIDDNAAFLRAKFPNTKLVRCYWCLAVWVAGLATVPYTLTAAALLTPLTWWQAALIWPPLTAAVAYASSWVLDKEEL